MSRHLLFIPFFGLLGATIWMWTHFYITSAAPPSDAAPHAEDIAAVPPESIYDKQSYTVQSGDVFTAAMEQLGISYRTALEIVAAGEEVFDFTRIREGRTFELYIRDGVQEKITYEPDAERVIVITLSPALTVSQEAIAYDVEERTAAATIASSLFVAGATAGLSDALIMDIAEVFAWTIDFATQVQEGDSFRVLYEARARSGTPAGHGNVLAAEFINNGRSYFGYLFEDADGKKHYYDSDGNSLVKQFLRAPLSYNRISSGFSYSRFHPTLGVNTAHRAIDYAAPMGTPIMSVGDGTVVFAGWGGGYGNFIKIRHNSTYQTHYAHLSRFATGIRVGATVTQGQVIGYVGSTGYSTGPHLHYEIQKDGTLVNPLQVEFPAGDPVADDMRAAFEARKQELHAALMN